MINKIIRVSFWVVMTSMIPLGISLIFTLNWPIFKLDPGGFNLSSFGALLVTLLALLLYVNIFLKQKNGLRGFRNILNNADTKVGGYFIILFGPLLLLFLYALSTSTLEHWQLKLLANDYSSVKVKVIRLDNNKFNWNTWKTRVEIIGSGKARSLILSKDMINDFDIGKCLKLSGRQNEYGMYIEQKTYISCEG
ncbi:MAG: hypothetical protein HUJ16_05225 [Kangiella sp.]|nr:hypothetical protein [Kangiella sp.]